jgi:hypothetical protein
MKMPAACHPAIAGAAGSAQRQCGATAPAGGAALSIRAEMPKSGAANSA